MKITLTELAIPGRFGDSDNAFTRLLTAESRRVLKLSPGRTFLVTDEAGRAVLFTKVQAAAIARGCVAPFRVQTRAAHDPAFRNIWLSMDPAYWEQLKRRRKTTS
ncbi:hypothetical protein [Changpingibacter yushuensis]|uniref:hypothetical protein n=1 Tax=Changpingibacter yushuensis TaxID=2758440 RepID=UPI00165E505C|nr:hypothetical protein [Changpingibacter yushuensis]